MKAIYSILFCLLLACFIGYYSYVNAYMSFNTFVGDALLQVMGTIFAINIGVIPVLYFELRKIEEILGSDDLVEFVKCEIRQNVSVMTLMIVVSVVLDIIKGFHKNLGIDYMLSSIILFMFFLIILMVHDTVRGILNLGKSVKNNS